MPALAISRSSQSAIAPPKLNRDELITNNLGLVHKIARRIKKTQPNIDYDDLVSAGTIGLIKAIDRHDSTKAKLSTFSQLYINGEIMREIRDKWQPVKIPRSHYELSGKLMRLLKENKSNEEIAKKLEITPHEFQSVKNSIRALKTCEPVEEVLSVDRESLKDNALITVFKNLSPPVQETCRIIANARRDVTSVNINYLRQRLGGSKRKVRGYVSQLKSLDLVTIDDLGIISINPDPLPYNPYDQIERLAEPTLKVFETICCMGRTTTYAIALKLNITQGRVRDYTNKLNRLGLIIKAGYFYQANFKPVVVKGIKQRVMQQIEVTNFVAKLEEWMKMKAQVQKLEEELRQKGGDRVEAILANLAVKK